MNCCDVELEFIYGKGIEEEIHIANCIICNTVYHKKLSQKHAYKSVNEDFTCTKCDSDILVADIAHTVRDGFFALSGSGKVKREQMPYCPKCETKPNFSGKSTS